MRFGTIHGVDHVQEGVFTLTVSAEGGRPWKSGMFCEHQATQRLFSVVDASPVDGEGFQVLSVQLFEGEEAA